MEKRTNYSPEVNDRAVRMVFEHERDYSSQWAIYLPISLAVLTLYLANYLTLQYTVCGRRKL